MLYYVIGAVLPILLYSQIIINWFADLKQYDDNELVGTCIIDNVMIKFVRNTCNSNSNRNATLTFMTYILKLSYRQIFCCRFWQFKTPNSMSYCLEILIFLFISDLMDNNKDKLDYDVLVF